MGGRRKPRYSDATLQRWLRTLPVPDIPFDQLAQKGPEEATLDGTFRVLEDSQGEGP